MVGEPASSNTGHRATEGTAPADGMQNAPDLSPPKKPTSAPQPSCQTEEGEMTSQWAEEVAARLDEAAAMITAFDLGSPDEVAGLVSSAKVLRRGAVTLAGEEGAARAEPLALQSLDFIPARATAPGQPGSLRIA